MTYTSCSGCYQTANYSKPMPAYQQSEHQSSRYSSNGIEMRFAPESAYAMTGKEYTPQ